MIEIKRITDKLRYLDLLLLLLGDEQEDLIYKYLDRGDMFGLFDDDILRTVCIVTKEDSDTCELKNIATYKEYQGFGYGKKLVQYILDYYRGKFKVTPRRTWRF